MLKKAPAALLLAATLALPQTVTQAQAQTMTAQATANRTVKVGTDGKEYTVEKTIISQDEYRAGKAKQSPYISADSVRRAANNFRAQNPSLAHWTIESNAYNSGVRNGIDHGYLRYFTSNSPYFFDVMKLDSGWYDFGTRTRHNNAALSVRNNDNSAIVTFTFDEVYAAAAPAPVAPAAPVVAAPAQPAPAKPAPAANNWWAQVTNFFANLFRGFRF